MMPGTPVAALLRPEQRDDARLAILVALLRADATSTGALLTAEGEGSWEDRLIALADRLAGRIGGVPGSYIAKGKG